jgi:phage tail sheath protein FI
MADFNAFNKTPGVYVQEIDRPGPIAGVGTSTAAIIGPAAKGPIGVPTFLTNLTQFTNAFGGYISSPPVYATHAVNGFFANGGSTLYFVRVGTAKSSALPLNDRAAGPGQPTLAVTAKENGVGGDAITVAVQDSAPPLAQTTVVKNESNLAGAGSTGPTVEVADASGFRPGDEVSVVVGANPAERRTVRSIAGNVLTLDTNLTHTGAAGSARIADLTAAQTRLRLAATTGLEPGSYVTVAQGGTTQSKVVASVEPVNRFVTLAQALGSAFSLAAADPAVQVTSLEFDLTVTHPVNGPTSFKQLAMDPRHSRYYRSVVTSPYVDVAPADPPNSTNPPANRPRVLAATNLAGGADDDVSAIGASHYQSALTALEKVDDVNILLAPDRTDLTVQKALIDHCEKMQERFAVLDPQPNADPATVTAQRNALNSDRGFAALYYPRIVIPDPLADGFLVVPPSGHIAGLYARVDDQKGVFKAPANETLRGLVGLERVLSDDENGPLNEIGVNVIRSFVGRGIRVWGARTIAPAAQTQWRYINVRRLMLFIEESLQEGTLSAVFEPNNEGLWETLKRTINGFLNRVWQSGALVGTKAEEAFRVRIDRELNPPEVRALGQLVIEVRVAPTTPAEFIVFRIIQQPGEPIIEE